MPLTLTAKLIEKHLADGHMKPGEEIGLHMDQVLLEDALGTLVMLELEAMETDRVKVDPAVQYVDHNVVESNNLSQEEHLFLRSACHHYGLWYSAPGNGVSHPTHMQRFGKPGLALVGNDSHTCAAGSLGMLAIGTGGMDVALALIGEPLYVRMPEVWGVKLTGALPDWVSAKDVILEMLRRHGVEGGFGRIVEYYGPGLDCLTAMDRHVISNQGAEMGATTTVFPSDNRTRDFLRSMGREKDWEPLAADEGATYDHHEELDLSALEPMIAKPSSPGNVVRVRDVAKGDIYQAYLGSSANPGFRDFAVAAEMVAGRKVKSQVSFDVNPTTRQIVQALTETGYLSKLVSSGARIHQAGCNGCIGMGQAPAKGRNSLRTVTRNFPGRSGTKEDSVYLCSPETATASALTGMITDPRDLNMPYPRLPESMGPDASSLLFDSPLDSVAAKGTKLEKTPNIVSLPKFAPAPKDLTAKVLLKLGDNISTDDITPAGEGLVRYSNIPSLSEIVYRDTHPEYAKSAKELRDQKGLHAIVAGHNYGQGSSREHSALAPRFLGLALVIAKSFARIHWQNLPNFGVVPLTFSDESAYDELQCEDEIEIPDLIQKLSAGQELEACAKSSGTALKLKHSLSKRQIAIICAGGAINYHKTKQAENQSKESPAK